MLQAHVIKKAFYVGVSNLPISEGEGRLSHIERFPGAITLERPKLSNYNINVKRLAMILDLTKQASLGSWTNICNIHS